MITERARFGDWEGDTLHGHAQDGFILSLVERTSRYLLAAKTASKQAAEVAQAGVLALQEMPQAWVKTLTLDNGAEFAHHHHLRDRLDLEVYFADPYASYQRGTNENTNGLIRRFLPQGTPFGSLTQQDLDRIVHALDHRPRKCLGYQTPQEVFDEQRRWRLVALGA